MRKQEYEVKAKDFWEKLQDGTDVSYRLYVGRVILLSEGQTLSISQGTMLTEKGFEPGYITSETEVSKVIWLRDDDGQEEDFEVAVLDLPVRDGHYVALVYGGGVGGKNLVLLAGRNLTTGKTSTHWDADAQISFGVLRAAKKEGIRVASVGAAVGAIQALSHWQSFSLLFWTMVGWALGLLAVWVFLSAGNLTPTSRKFHRRVAAEATGSAVSKIDQFASVSKVAT